jgi:hypothetical protein
MTSSTEQPTDKRGSFISTAAALSTPELKSTIKALQEMLQEREMQSYDFAKEGFDKLIGLDKTKIKLGPLKTSSPKYFRFIEEKQEAHRKIDRTIGRMDNQGGVDVR